MKENHKNNYNTFSCSNSLRVPSATAPTAKQQQQMNLAAIQKPRASYPEIMNPRLSLNGTLRHLVPSPRPLYRDRSANKQTYVQSYQPYKHTATNVSFSRAIHILVHTYKQRAREKCKCFKSF